MSKCHILCVMLFAGMLVSGCDFFRQLAGRPTSADIEAKRVRIDSIQAAHQARLDSMKLLEKKISDSLAVLDAIAASENAIVSSGKLGGLISAQLPYRYYIIVGAFSNPENADKMVGIVSASGREATKIRCRNGFVAVGVCPSNSLPQVYDSLQVVKQTKFCPSDAWIIVNE